LDRREEMELSVKHFYIVLGWILWCTLHSALISITVTEYVKRRLGSGFRFYRLFYSAVSVATLIPLGWYSRRIGGTPLFSWDGPLAIVPVLLLTAGVYLFVVGGRNYSWAKLLGIAQIRAGRADRSASGGDSFVVSGLHRFVRHPWYLGGIMIVWVQELSLPTILINMVICAYFIIGSFLEERKLVREFGDAYREYQRTVSMLFPWRWIKAKVAALSN
jgi:protein-S-isoprenylcysteine O-methyltransferase Ste14